MPMTMTTLRKGLRMFVLLFSRKLSENAFFLLGTHFLRPSSTTTKLQLMVNYDSWCIKIEAVLNQRDRWIKLDVNPTTSELITKAKAAYYDIIIYDDDQHARFLKSVAKDNSVKALVALKEKYEGKGAMSKFQLLLKCLKSKYSTGRLETRCTCRLPFCRDFPQIVVYSATIAQFWKNKNRKRRFHSY